jgi:hypothetical protein
MHIRMLDSILVFRVFTYPFLISQKALLAIIGTFG